MKAILYIALLSLMSVSLHAQDSLSTTLSYHDYKLDDRSYIAKRSAMRSALIPGWGQYTNDQIIKIPFIYLALGTTTYLIVDNYNKYRLARKAYLYRLDGNPNTEVEKYRNASTNYLQNEKQVYRELIDYSVLATLAFYTLNILDAAVFSHLKDFDVSDDLSFRPTLKLQPYGLAATGYAPTLGLRIYTK